MTLDPLTTADVETLLAWAVSADVEVSSDNLRRVVLPRAIRSLVRAATSIDDLLGAITADEADEALALAVAVRTPAPAPTYAGPGSGRETEPRSLLDGVCTCGHRERDHLAPEDRGEDGIAWCGGTVDHPTLDDVGCPCPGYAAVLDVLADPLCVCGHARSEHEPSISVPELRFCIALNDGGEPGDPIYCRCEEFAAAEVGS